MSLPDMIGGASCGPVNPLQQLGKRFGHDRGAQFDTQRPAPEMGHANFRTRGASAENPEFFSGAATGPFDVAPLREALPQPLVHHAGPARADFEASFKQSRGASTSRAAPSWANDFMAAGPRAQAVPAKAGGPSVAQRPAGMPMQSMRPMLRPMAAMPQMHAPGPHMQHHAEPHLAESSWESAYTQWEALQKETLADGVDGDELARTAARLLSSVEHDTGAKFQQSQFLALMKKLRDREAVVDGSEIVEAGKGKTREAPLRDSLADMLAEGALQSNNLMAPPAQALDPEVQKELEELWAEEDRQREGVSSRAFVGDGGNVAERMREDEEDAREFARWSSAAPRVSGAQSSWEEAIDDDFVGRAWTGMQGSGVRNAQDNEWDKLQSDWDEFEATTAGIRRTRISEPFPFEAPQYRFNENNPYVHATTRHHAAHSAGVRHVNALSDSVLECEAQVQHDPTDAGAWYNLGIRQQENEREIQAIAALRRAVELDPNMQDAWLALAVSYTNENDRAETLAAIERWIDTATDYSDVVMAYRTSAGTQKPSEERRIVGELMAMARASMSRPGDSQTADVQVALGVLFNASSEYDKAVDCFSTALSMRPDDYLLYNRIGATLSNSGRSDEAIMYYEHALNMRPGFARCHFNMSISCLNLKNYQEAAEHAYTALTLQNASDDDGVPMGKNLQSTNLWETLRVSLELMDRPDLASKTLARDISKISLEDILQTS
ncbi:hypothetical protein MCUN1_003372 [Malassezia cuniculi]|uniref:Peroxisomal targeting signal receptor n=1 Tax=Malassezia cuniculi TaxID=948313 RepID=A0AAF0J7C9_9BASI|nr:hypothetical protein MCUN1_003372 [Malassezia cuniculi]